MSVRFLVKRLDTRLTEYEWPGNPRRVSGQVSRGRISRTRQDPSMPRLPTRKLSVVLKRHQSESLYKGPNNVTTEQVFFIQNRKIYRSKRLVTVHTFLRTVNLSYKLLKFPVLDTPLIESR